MPMVKIFRTIEQSDNWSIIFFQSVLLNLQQFNESLFNLIPNSAVTVIFLGFFVTFFGF